MHFFYCDNIKGILILVKNDKGIKFGVFIKKTCDGDYNSKKDENAFCLSIPLKKINKIIKNKEDIRYDPNLGHVFLDDIFGFRKENLQNGESYINYHCHYLRYKLDFEINDVEKIIKPDEIKVFHIFFE